MKHSAIFTLLFFAMTQFTVAQDSNDYYYEIPDFPEAYTPHTVAARMVDGFGFRYYWATKDLREQDMSYKPSEDSRTIRQTLEHIYGLSRTVMTAPLSKVNTYPKEELSFEELRQRTLDNIEQASKVLKQENAAMDEYKMIFQRGEDTIEHPFWNVLNGPLADAIYHTGQVVAYRRASGNPIPKGVRMLTGKKTE